MGETSEAYCVDSGHPVRYEAGDRCIAHGDRDTPCFAALRPPRCTHPRWPKGANGSANCPECGAVVTP
jgi:hypothetical protein